MSITVVAGEEVSKNLVRVEGGKSFVEIAEGSRFPLQITNVAASADVSFFVLVLCALLVSFRSPPKALEIKVANPTASTRVHVIGLLMGICVSSDHLLTVFTQPRTLTRCGPCRPCCLVAVR